MLLTHDENVTALESSLVPSLKHVMFELESANNKVIDAMLSETASHACDGGGGCR